MLYDIFLYSNTLTVSLLMITLLRLNVRLAKITPPHNITTYIQLISQKDREGRANLLFLSVKTTKLYFYLNIEMLPLVIRTL